MKITNFITFIATLLWVSSADLAAQEKSVIDIGVLIRVTAPPISTAKLIGTRVALNGDTLLLQTENPAFSNPLAIPLHAITRFEVSRGKGSRGKSALKGSLIGFLVALPSTFIVLEANAASLDLGDDSILLGSLIGGAGGLIVGGLLGSQLPGEHNWEFVPVNRIRARIAPKD